MRRAVTRVLWAILILVAVAAAGVGTGMVSETANEAIAATSNELLGLWAETALKITRALRE